MTRQLRSILSQSLRTLLVGLIVLAVVLVAGVLSAGPGGLLHPTSAVAQAQVSPTPTALPATTTVVPTPQAQASPTLPAPAATALPPTATVVPTPQGTPRPLLRLPSFPTASPAPQDTPTTTAAPPVPQGTVIAATAVPGPLTNPNPTLLNVIGMDEQRLTPDMAIVSLGVQTTGTTVAEASNSNNETMTAVIAAVKSAGIEDADIQSTSIGLVPVYARPARDDPNAPPTITGYQATNMVSVYVLDLSQVGAIITAGLDAGVNQFGGVSFALRDRTQPYLAALAAATIDARLKADAIATAAGMVVSGIGEITEESAGVPRPLAASVQFAERGAGAAAPVEIGEIVVHARVRVQFRLAAAPAA